jgi:hypothetical protein
MATIEQVLPSTEFFNSGSHVKNPLRIAHQPVGSVYFQIIVFLHQPYFLCPGFKVKARQVPDSAALHPATRDVHSKKSPQAIAIREWGEAKRLILISATRLPNFARLASARTSEAEFPHPPD